MHVEVVGRALRHLPAEDGPSAPDGSVASASALNTTGGPGGGDAIRTPAHLALIVLAVVAGGCVTVRSEPASFANPWPPLHSGPRPAVELVVSGGAIVDGIPRDLGPILDDFGAVTERAYRESALFSDVALRSERHDLRVAVAIRAGVHQYELLSALSYLTLFIIPHVVTTNLAVTTTVSADNGQPLGTVEVPGRGRTWHQLLLLPFAPFYEPRNVTPDIVYDLNREAITTLHARGVF